MRRRVFCPRGQEQVANSSRWVFDNAHPQGWYWVNDRPIEPSLHTLESLLDSEDVVEVSPVCDPRIEVPDGL